MKEMKVCITCKETKEADLFVVGENKCLDCQIVYDRVYYQKNKIKRSSAKKAYRAANKEKQMAYNKQYQIDNKEEIKQQKQTYYQTNKKEILAENKIYRQANKEKLNANERQKKKNDPIYKLRKNVSSQINKKLHKRGSSKNGSIMQHLPYTMEQLRNHLEALFSHPSNLVDGKIWMTWENHGSYHKSKWNDFDPSTWVWNIDHREPHSDFNYTSMSDQSFQNCWALDNLRPLSAKLNQLEGVNRTRHKK
jgi:hypothetical protein